MFSPWGDVFAYTCHLSKELCNLYLISIPKKLHDAARCGLVSSSGPPHRSGAAPQVLTDPPGVFQHITRLGWFVGSVGSVLGGSFPQPL